MALITGWVKKLYANFQWEKVVRSGRKIQVSNISACVWFLPTLRQWNGLVLNLPPIEICIKISCIKDGVVSKAANRSKFK